MAPRAATASSGLTTTARLTAAATVLTALLAAAVGLTTPGGYLGGVGTVEGPAAGAQVDPAATWPVGPSVPPSVPPPPAVPSPAVPAQTAPAPVVAADAARVRSAPVRVQVEGIDLDSGLMDLGLAADGTVEVPPDGSRAGWFTGAPSPGQTGPAVLIGHVDWGGAAGVFRRLGELAHGDEIRVTSADGAVMTFAVTEVGQFAKDAFPTAEVYGNIDHAGLRLITCGGEFDDGTGHYEDNVVVFADLVGVQRT